MKIIRITIILFTAAGLIYGHTPPGSIKGGAGKGVSNFSTSSLNDSLIFSIDVFGYFSTSWADRWQAGEPLGTGGKIPLYYNENLYLNETGQNQYLYKSDLFIQYSDFGYVPIWQPDQVSLRLEYHFLPQVWGVLETGYTDNLSIINTQDMADVFQLGEANIKWLPLQAFAVSVGRLRLAENYCEPFDHLPLENFRFNGVMSQIRIPLDEDMDISLKAAAGKEFICRTIVDYYTNDRGFLSSIVNRNHLFTSIKMDWYGKLSMKGQFGYQVVPADSTGIPYGHPSDPDRKLFKAQGWHAGYEANHYSRLFNQSFVAAYGSGDVNMGWGSPDYIKYSTPNPDTASYLDSIDILSKKDCALLYGVYWNRFRYKKLSVSTGVWGQKRMPAKINTLDMDYVGITEEGENIWDSAYVVPEDFRAAKWMVEPCIQLFIPIGIGLRYDRIRYYDIHARTNVREYRTDQTLIYVLDPEDDRIEEWARWDKEPINAHVYTPYINVSIKNIFEMRAAYSRAYYEKPVMRQNVVSDFHSNITVSAKLVYRFAKLEDEDF